MENIVKLGTSLKVKIEISGNIYELNVNSRGEVVKISDLNYVKPKYTFKCDNCKTKVDIEVEPKTLVPEELWCPVCGFEGNNYYTKIE